MDGAVSEIIINVLKRSLKNDSEKKIVKLAATLQEKDEQGCAVTDLVDPLPAADTERKWS